MAESRLIVWSEEVQMDMEEVAEFYDLRNGSPIYSQYLIYNTIEPSCLNESPAKYNE